MRAIGYLCSEFPALSHTFISREIAILEREGFRIVAASINSSAGLEKMGADDRARAASTYYVKRTPVRIMAARFISYGLRFPRFLSVLAFSLAVAYRAGPRDLRKALGYFFQAILLHAWARENGLTHIHVHFANPAATVALIATRFGNLGFSMSVHGPDEFYDVERNNLREKVRDAAFVRCIGYFCRSQLMKLTPSDQWWKCRIVRCGLFKDEFEPRPARAGKARNILCVGRVCPSKGQAILVEVARILRDKDLDFRMVLLGGGEDLAAIRALIDDRGLGGVVEAVGPVGHARVREELARADVFVLPSFAEGIPVALMEAMAAGIPVVSTQIAGIPELIEHGKEGFLTQASNSGQLAAVLEDFIRGRVDTRSLTENAAAKVRSEYDVERNTKELGALFESLGGIR